MSMVDCHQKSYGYVPLAKQQYLVFPQVHDLSSLSQFLDNWSNIRDGFHLMKLDLSPIRQSLITPTTFVSVLSQHIMQGISVFIIFEYFYSVFWFGELLIHHVHIKYTCLCYVFPFCLFQKTSLNLLSSHYLYVFTEGQSLKSMSSNTS